VSHAKGRITIRVRPSVSLTGESLPVRTHAPDPAAFAGQPEEGASKEQAVANEHWSASGIRLLTGDASPAIRD
jgi:hypothetical protein